MSRLLLPARLESTWLLVEALRVDEVLGLVPWLRLPNARRAVPGILAWRARAVPIVDLAAFLPDLSPLNPSRSRSRTLIMQASGSTLALPVDGAREVESVPIDAIRPQHAVACSIAAAEVELRNEFMMVLDWDALLQQLFDQGASLPGETA